MSLGSLSEGPSMKSFDYLIPSMAAKCSECLSFSYSLTLSLSTHGENEIAGFGLRRGLFSLPLVKVSTSSFP
jgi:hypothetical protein